MSDVVETMTKAAVEADERMKRADYFSYPELIRAALSAAEAAGWRLVPVEPTPEMMKAACETVGGIAVNTALAIAHVHGWDLPDECIDDPVLKQEWRAMISAAPRAGI